MKWRVKLKLIGFNEQTLLVLLFAILSKAAKMQRMHTVWKKRVKYQKCTCYDILRVNLTYFSFAVNVNEALFF